MAAEAHHELLAKVDAPQSDSLFFKLPAELRIQIYKQVLEDFMDPSPTRQYRKNTCFTRSSYYAPRRSDVQLLRTCRAVYRETWSLPFVLREQTVWLTDKKRAPPGNCFDDRQGNTRWKLTHRLHHATQL